MAGLLDQAVLSGLLYNYADQYKDQAGFPVDTNRPIVYDPGKYEPHTELTETYKASELGLPGKGYYNVPTIYNGQMIDTEKDFDLLKKNVQEMAAKGYQFPSFPSVEEAVKQAQARSAYIGSIRGQELQDSVEKRKQQYLMGLLGM
jgi:hypothetical protein